MSRLLAFAMALSVAFATQAAPKPSRIVSLNLCTDQLLMLLADRDRIASISYLSTNPDASAMADIAAGLPINYGRAEEILPLMPDLVLAGAFTTRPTVFLLRGLGYNVVELPVASNIEDVRKNIRAVAEALGEAARGAAAIDAFDGQLSKLKASAGRAPPLAALYWANGYTSGAGTLANAVIKAAGFNSLADNLGLSGTRKLPLEMLVMADPDLFVIGRVHDDPALAYENLRHPALRRVFGDRTVVRIPDRLWVCGTPFVAEAVARLAAFRDRASRR